MIKPASIIAILAICSFSVNPILKARGSSGMWLSLLLLCSHSHRIYRLSLSFVLGLLAVLSGFWLPLGLPDRFRILLYLAVWLQLSPAALPLQLSFLVPFRLPFWVWVYLLYYVFSLPSGLISSRLSART